MNDFKLHQTYLKENSFFRPNYFKVFFTDKEKIFLSNWYNWMCGLVENKIPPLNLKQKKFIEVYNLHIKPNSRPPKEFEKWYNDLTNEQKTFVRYYYVSQHKENIKSIIQQDLPDSIYSISKVLVNFGEDKDFRGEYRDTLMYERFKKSHLDKPKKNQISKHKLEIIESHERREKNKLNVQKQLNRFSVDRLFFPKHKPEFYFNKTIFSQDEKNCIIKNFDDWMKWINDSSPSGNVKKLLLSLNSDNPDPNSMNFEESTFHYFFNIVKIHNSEGKREFIVEENQFYKTEDIKKMKNLMYENTRDNHIS